MGKDELSVEGEADPLPWKLWLLGLDGEPVKELKSFATEEEARTAATRLDIRYGLQLGRGKMQRIPSIPKRPKHKS